MKIIGLNPLQGVSRPTDIGNAARKREVARGNDGYSPSNEALDRSAARRGVMATPDVRADRVSELRARIESGTYDVTPWDIASRMVDARA